MRATTVRGAGDLRVDQVPDARVTEPTDAVVRVLMACVCGTDLWVYRGVAGFEPGQRIGHEFLGEVVQVGSQVSSVAVGDLVVAPFMWSDGNCEFCADGLQSMCTSGGMWGSKGSDGGQAEAVRVPVADGTLVRLPKDVDRALLPALLTLSDVLTTGHHAAVCAGVGPGSTVAVVGDGAVGLCGVLAARRLGAERIIVLGRHEQRTEIARRFGATDVVPERGQEAVHRVRELTGGHGARSVLECVGTEQAWLTAIGSARPGGAIGYVGAPHEVAGLPLGRLFVRNLTISGGMAPARAYIPQLLPDVLSGAIDPSPVFDLTVDLDHVAEGYRAMDDRSALKVLVTP
ncbi:zinc-dependent alcohol dehydrogenase family protein [Kutzneria albida]|uniref:Alcohol dehydrogenase n=1 Tax=Kutzneria albida DSM 43870 TaxID=1449976 RepID=W5W2F2_9PSEU|nr:zinc-dependent alcohol dehydrogenase family protein [Kutzneria albida]AHH94656.1 alcohol dehydrogenase [Kutzneria albida DSM 43870]